MRIWQGQDAVDPSADGVYDLACWTTYAIESDQELCAPGLPLEVVPPVEPPYKYRVGFGDYVGQLELAGTRIRVGSKKLDSAGFERLLQDITARIADLPFDASTPTFIPFSRDEVDGDERLYQVLVYLRWAMRLRSPTIPESWAEIEADPHRVLIREERMTSPWAARGVTPRTIERIAAHPETWVAVDSRSFLGKTALARRLADPTGQRHFPHTVREVVAESCLDNPENRFVAYALDTALELVQRGCDRLGSPGLDPSVLADLEQVAGSLRHMRESDFLAEVSAMQRFPAHSQVLQRRSGYREILTHYQALILASRYPIDARDLQRIIETKSASTLYEYWCFFQLAEELEQLLGPSTRAAVASGDDLHGWLGEGISIAFPGQFVLHYNRSFSRSNPRWFSYSVPLRPDIVLEAGDGLHLFDAKFRVDRFDDPSDAELAEEEDADKAGRAAKGWFKRPDVHKMHAYKDALGSGDARVQTVWVLYPGSAFAFYAEDTRRTQVPTDASSRRGVGAIPLTPGSGAESLRAVLRGIASRS